MYHFKETNHAASTLVLDEHIELSGCAVRHLKDFQISAVRFLYEHFRKRQFCILNDESGLGKIATAAVLLGIVATKRNCLIVVGNDDEHITDWQFHLDILTDLNVHVLDDEKDFNDSNSTVYIAKWNTLRMIADLNKLSFDIIVLDNRDQMLNNTFCMSTLLKNFERKVQLVISSMDLTSDVKLLHNILRLGGRLEHQLESFKSFEEKYHLPDIKAISNKKSDLNEYFLKREILSNYCRDFRLRRYRHQYEHILPLVDPARYKAHLVHWKETKTNMMKKKPKPMDTAVIINESIQTDIGTEELLQQYLHQSNQLDQDIDKEVEKITENMKTIANNDENTQRTSNEGNDDELNMSPLVYQSESDDDSDAEVVLLSSNSIEAVIPIIEIDDNDGDDDVNVVECTIKPIKHLEDNTTKKNNRKEVEENGKQKEISNESIKEKHIINLEKKAKVKKYIKVTEEPEVEKTKRPYSKRTRSKNSMILEEESDAITSRRILRKNSTMEVKKKEKKNMAILPNNVKNHEHKINATKKIENKQNSKRKSLNETKKIVSPQLVIKKEKISPVKKLTEKETSTEKTGTTATTTTMIRTDEKSSGIEEKCITTKQVQEQQNSNTPSSLRTRISRVEKSMIGVPQRETRNMQRATRSAGSKRKCYALEFDEDSKKSKMRTTTAKRATLNSATTTTTTSKSLNKKIKTENNSPKTPKQQITTTPSKTKNDTIRNTTKPPSKPKSNASTSSKSSQSSIQCSNAKLPTSSDYEEIQCGQQMASVDNSPQLPTDKPNEFLLPATPPSLRMLHNSLLQPSHSITPFKIFEKDINIDDDTDMDTDTDIAIISNGINSSSSSRGIETVFVPSSQDEEASLSSQASLAQPNKKQKRKRHSKRVSVKDKPTKLGYALAKQRNSVPQSPDLFSTGSDIACSNLIPFTQIHCTTATTSSTNTTAFGFKIFGSEVRRQQDITATTLSNANESPQRQSRGNRSCLNILEQIFEKRNPTQLKTTTKQAKAAAATATKQQFEHNKAETSKSAAATKSLVAPRKPIHERNQKRNHHHHAADDISSDDIFEITNNATFGSTLRINASGNISPVQQQQQQQQFNFSQQNNKITNYLIGSGNTKSNNNGNVDDEQQQQQQSFGTPNKQRLAITQVPGNGSSSGSGPTATGTTTKKSPKSLKLTQTTKLTKWFRRSSVDDTIKAGKDRNPKESKATKTTKRRRLDLSFKS